jgi:hypothetical protein
VNTGASMLRVSYGLGTDVVGDRANECDVRYLSTSAHMRPAGARSLSFVAWVLGCAGPSGHGTGSPARVGCRDGLVVCAVTASFTALIIGGIAFGFVITIAVFAFGVASASSPPSLSSP